MKAIAAATVLLIVFAACRQQQPSPAKQPAEKAAAVAPAPAPPPPPPPPPETSLGKLTKVERASEAAFHALCGEGRFLGVVSGGGKDPFDTAQSAGKTVYRAKDGVEVTNGKLRDVGLALCEQRYAARSGKEFVVLTFEGEQKRSVNRADMGDFMTFHPLASTRYLSRIDEQSLLTDAAGKKYTGAGAVVHEKACTLVFEVPAGTQGLVWKDGKKSYSLEPHATELAN
jgi:hypothetical protein